MTGLKIKEQRVIMSAKNGPGISIPATDTSKKFICCRHNILKKKTKKIDEIS